MASRCEGITVAVVGFRRPGGRKGVQRRGDHQGRKDLLDVYHKVELPNYGVFDEKRYFSPGKGCPLYEVSGVPFAVTICEDVWVPKSDAEKTLRR